MNKKLAMLLLGLGCTFAYAQTPGPTPRPDPAACESNCYSTYRTCPSRMLVPLCESRLQSCLATCHPGTQ